VTTASPADLRNRPHEACASRYAGYGMLRGHAVTQNLTFAARWGAGLVYSAEGNPA
jgi:hypothetical protein